MADDALGTWLPSAGGRATLLPGGPTAPIDDQILTLTLLNMAAELVAYPTIVIRG